MTACTSGQDPDDSPVPKGGTCTAALMASARSATIDRLARSARISELTRSDLPRAWRRYPAPLTLQELGNSWLDEAATAVLRVPSAVVPTECNYLINPLHPDIKKLRVVRRFRFAFDERLTFESKPANSGLHLASAGSALP